MHSILTVEEFKSLAFTAGVHNIDITYEEVMEFIIILEGEA